MGAFEQTEYAIGRYKNAEEALIKLVDADDRLNTLKLYFNNKQVIS